MMGYVHNNSAEMHIAVNRKCIPPRGYMELTPEEMGNESIQRHLNMGLLEVVENPRGLTPAQIVMENLEPNGNLLIQRSYALGDVFLMSALARNIREKYPNIRIHLGTTVEAAPLLNNNPNIELYAGVEFRDCISEYGDFINMNNLAEVYEDSLRPEVNLNRIEIMCNILGVEPVHLCPEYYITRSEIENGYKFLSNLNKPILGIAPVSRRKEKTWPVEKFIILVNLWKSRTGGSVLIFHDGAIQSLIEAGAKTLHYFDLRMAAAVAYHVDFMVALDSLWTHLAAALSIPQVLLTSCTDGKLLSKGYPGVTCVIPDQECYPCWYFFEKGGCVIGHYPKCLNAIEPEMVFDRILEVFNAGED